MEAPAFWTVDPNADREQVESLIASLADELGIPAPPLIGDPPGTVVLPPQQDRVTAALDTVRPGWQEASLIWPSSGVVTVPIRTD